MITSWQLYWLTRLDSIGCFFTVIGTICFLGEFIFGIVSFINKDLAYGEESKKKTKSMIKLWLKLLPIPVVAFFIAVFIPSTKEAAAILVLPRIINNAEVQKLPGNVLDLANQWIEELKPKKESK